MMSSRLARSIAAAFVLIGATAPGSAAGVARNSQGRQVAPTPVATTASNAGHFIQGTRGTAFVSGPTACTGSGSNSFVGGGVNNFAVGTDSGVLGGENNSPCAVDDAIAGGIGNLIGSDSAYTSYDASIVGGLSNGIVGAAGAIIGGGINNLISNEAPSPYQNSNLSAIGAGNMNIIVAPNSFIGSGMYNEISPPNFSVPNTPDAFIGAGYGNKTSADYAVIGGGYTNIVTGEWSTIAGGYDNMATSTQEAVGGGYGNVASGRDATIPGGASNSASGSNSFAAGTKSSAATVGSFVWSDDSTTAGGVIAYAPNQFLARSAGGFYLYTSPNLSTGVRLPPGSGAWSNLSDRSVKTAIDRVDDALVLAKLSAMPVSEWSYAAQGQGVRHIGPMAQDFRAAFGLGEDDRHISTIDEEGVALAAIKALQAEVVQKSRKLAVLDVKVGQLARRLEILETNSRNAGVSVRS